MKRQLSVLLMKLKGWQGCSSEMAPKSFSKLKKIVSEDHRNCKNQVKTNNNNVYREKDSQATKHQSKREV